jgi:FtsH-binding integral membrane protein
MNSPTTNSEDTMSYGMQQSENPYAPANFLSLTAAQASENERAAFITKTYLHLAGAIVTFVLLEAVLLSLPITEQMIGLMVGQQYSWLIVMGAFIGVSWLAESWALSSQSLEKQYLGLGLYVLAQAIIMAPMLYFAQSFHPNIIATAGITTLGLFAVLTTVVFVTRTDFSFLRSALMFGAIAAFGLIVCAILFNFALGPIFTYAMIALACGYILYDTSNVMHHYRTTQYVAAALALFASVALLFWYVLRLFMSKD